MIVDTFVLFYWIMGAIVFFWIFFIVWKNFTELKETFERTGRILYRHYIRKGSEEDDPLDYESER